jgi:hypothetical protein
LTYTSGLVTDQCIRPSPTLPPKPPTPPPLALLLDAPMPKVLKEETYTECISQIIKRDYFSGRTNNDSQPSTATSTLSLDDFFAKYTSQDNHSYSQLKHNKSQPLHRPLAKSLGIRKANCKMPSAAAAAVLPTTTTTGSIFKARKP